MQESGEWAWGADCSSLGDLASLEELVALEQRPEEERVLALQLSEERML